jgi:ribosomal subunit interface protein
MRLELTGRHLVISQGLRNLVTRKLGKVHRVLNDTGVSAAVIVTTEKVANVVEITLHTRGERFLHAVAKAPTWETATTDAVAKILHQAETVKNKWQERKKRGPAARSVKTPRAVRRTTARKAGEPASAKRAPARVKR